MVKITAVALCGECEAAICPHVAKWIQDLQAELKAERKKTTARQGANLTRENIKKGRRINELEDQLKIERKKAAADKEAERERAFQTLILINSAAAWLEGRAFGVDYKKERPKHVSEAFAAVKLYMESDRDGSPLRT